jgi:ribonucleoside-triphosphate reductase (formate)
MAGQQIFPEWKTILGTASREAQPTRHVVKRSGDVQRYDRAKIEAAVAKAFEAVGELPPEGAEAESESAARLKKVVDLVELKLRDLMGSRHPNSIPAIEEIQDLVETALVEAAEAKAAKAYIIYRAKHEAMRDAARLMLDINTTMDGYLSQADWRVKENANVNYSLGGLILHNSGTITANYWLKNIYPEEIAQAHRDADFHIHDLSMFSGYCAGWSLRQLIAEGLGGVPDKITSKPASHLSTLVQQMVNFLGVLQNEWAGAQALSSFDTYLAPFVKKDDLSEAEVRQCMQSFLFGVNTPSRWGSQAPFTNVTLDWTCPDDLRDKESVVGGKGTGFSYGDCQAEMDLVNKVFIDLMLEGDAMGRGFAYPIPTYNITKDFDWDSPNAKLLFEMTAKYGTPYFQNFISSDLDPGDVRSMCCRLQLDKRELRKRGGGLFGSDELTGSVGVVTINLPRIGFLANGGRAAGPRGRGLRGRGSPDQGSRSDFYSRLDALMDLAARSLEIKRKVISRLLEGGLFPYTRRYLGSFDNHFNTIGLVGMHECCLNFLGLGIETVEGRAFSLEVLAHMRERLQDYQAQTGQLFNLEATPAESTSYRLAKHDRETWPDIIASGGGAGGEPGEPYYTNSSQLPVGFTPDIFDALDHQEALQASYTGGTVFHVFLGEAPEDWRAVSELVKAIATKYRIPYFTISPTFSICPVHGYLSGEHFNCPRCKAEKEERIRGEIRVLEAELASAT